MAGASRSVPSASFSQMLSLEGAWMQEGSPWAERELKLSRAGATRTPAARGSGLRAWGRSHRCVMGRLRALPWRPEVGVQAARICPTRGLHHRKLNVVTAPISHDPRETS